ncbi:hypothetical protein UFOVP42_8 [uncultured Caudovirales phage]|uniref:Uncharacterized protein n=1 Tax=uncultured Caudovirales phage TaxID=2100421 RepID=A0A6J5KLY9_9CAUD|nr:hypothetical protein UFOVP42_8 [uncultured Caudovirales phage]
MKPVAYFVKDKQGWWAETDKETGIPLYTHPVKELTDEEILGCWVEEFTGNALPSIDFARAILKKAQEK